MTMDGRRGRANVGGFLLRLALYGSFGIALAVYVRTELARGSLGAGRPLSGDRLRPGKRSMAIYWQGSRLGTSTWEVSLGTDRGRLGQRIEMEIPSGSERFPLRFESEVLLDGEKKPRELSLRLDSPLFSTRLEGRIRGRRLTLVDGTGKERHVSLKGMDLMDPLFPLSPTREVPIGSPFKVSVWNPVTGRQEIVEAVPKKRGSRRFYPRYSTEYNISWGDLEARAWIDLEGELLCMELPWGLVLAREDVGSAPKAKGDIGRLVEYLSGIGEERRD